MPELPEVETIVRAYRARVEGRAIVRFSSSWAKNVQPSLRAVRRAIEGRRIERLWRRGKFIVADLCDDRDNSPKRARDDACAAAGHLLIHLRMSGRFEWSGDHEDDPGHVRAWFELDDGHRLLFCDPRKFGRILFTRDCDAATGHLGLEPLGREFTAAAFERLLHGRRRQIKPLLLDQSVVAGLGNIYVDEALFGAGIHPATRSETLSSERIRRLRDEIRGVLREAIRRRGTSFDQAYRGGGMQQRLRVYGRVGEPCRKCKTPIEGLRIGQRGTHICPKCQPLDSGP